MASVSAEVLIEMTPAVEAAIRSAVAEAAQRVKCAERERIARILIREGGKPELPLEARDFLPGLAERL